MLTDKERTIMLIFENGEHMIGREVESDDIDVIVLEDPVNLMPDQASGRLMFYQATQFCEGNVLKIKKSGLRCSPVVPKDDIYAGYDKQFGTGLVVPESNIIQV